MHLLFTFARAYPLHTAIMVIALLIAGFMEGIGLSMLLPLVGIAVSRKFGSEQGHAADSSTAESALEKMVVNGFSVLGISPTVGVLLVVIIATIILKSGLMLLAKKHIGYTVARVATDLRLELLRALFVSRWQYFLKQPLGGLANSMATETARASKSYHSSILMTAEFFQAFIYCLMAFLVSWKATLISLTAGFFILYVLKHFLRKARQAGIRQTDLLKSLLTLLTDTLQSIKPLKAMARENVSDLLLEKKTNRLNKALQKQVLNKEFLKAFQETLLSIFLAAGLYILLVHWQMPLTNVMIMAFLVAKLLKKLNKVQERYQEMVIFESAYWSLKDTIQTVKNEHEVLEGCQTPTLNRAIRMEHVNFGYDDRQVLHSVTLDFPAGQISAILGPSGSGKTTIVDLVIGLLKPREGEVWIDDVPFVQVNQKQWRRMIGYIPQDPILMHDTVINNITFGDAKIAEQDVKKALQAAGAWEFVKNMPNGMQTIVGERGGKLSGGQRQRISIARAIMHNPKLLILDEATSALDPASEAAILETLQQLRGRLTILAISHQSALVGIADKVYRVKDGKIVATEGRSEDCLHAGNVNAESDPGLQLTTNAVKVL